MDEQALDPLDAYSAVVTRVVREVAPSVASLTVLGERGPLGSGSGVVIDVGILVTNAHVAGRGRRVVASFSDGSRADAAVAGVDRLSDLAVLRTGDALPAPAVLGDADTLQVGQLVVAIGNPMGLGRSLPSRSGTHTSIIEDVIQTDAALNPGNSGGALVDATGRVVGVNTAVAGIGLGLAVPVNATTRRILDALLRDGHVRRSFLGVAAAPSPLPPDLAAKVGRAHGIRLAHVEPGSPGAVAGLRDGDLVVTVGGQPVADAQDLQRRLFAHVPGDPLAITTYRNGAMVDVIAHPASFRSDAD